MAPSSCSPPPTYTLHSGTGFAHVAPGADLRPGSECMWFIWEMVPRSNDHQSSKPGKGGKLREGALANSHVGGQSRIPLGHGVLGRTPWALSLRLSVVEGCSQYSFGTSGLPWTDRRVLACQRRPSGKETQIVALGGHSQGCCRLGCRWGEISVLHTQLTLAVSAAEADSI